MTDRPKSKVYNSLVSSRVIWEVILSDGYRLIIESELYNKSSQKYSFFQHIYNVLVGGDIAVSQSRSDKTLLALMEQVQSGPNLDKISQVMDVLSQRIHLYLMHTWGLTRVKSHKKWNLQFSLKLMSPEGNMILERPVLTVTGKKKTDIYNAVSKQKALHYGNEQLIGYLFLGDNKWYKEI